MKKSGFAPWKHWDIRVFFSLIVFVELIAAAALTLTMVYLLRQIFDFSVGFFTLLWAALTSTCISMGVTAVINLRLFGPIRRLGQAMEQVARGDFKIQLQADSRIRDIRAINENFNAMVRALDATEMLQSDFVSNVSHEFKTPINAIEGYAMLLQDAGQNAEEQQEYIEKILLNTQRLSGLIGNVLLLSKLENQAIPAQCRRFRLDEQIRQSIMLLESRWCEKEIEFDVDMEDVDYTGNESLLLHVWSNLIGNAIKFNIHGGAIRLRLFREGANVVFTVEDEGPGLSPMEMEHIFDKFYQGDNSHRQEGNGLGLALVKRILPLCGGRIEAVNLPEKGCRFTVRLPETKNTEKT